MSKTIKNTAELFKAMGDESRLKIIKLISSKGNKLCVGAIVNQLNISQPAVSQHLKVLKGVGLVEAERDGFHIHYKLVPEILNTYGIDLISFLKTFGSELNLENKCEFNGHEQKCNELN